MRIQLLHAHLAPPGKQRLLSSLATALEDPRMQSCRMVVAFAKRSGVSRLLPYIRAFRLRGGTIEVNVGVDVQGTSREALELLLSEVDEVYVTHQPGSTCTFHPKLYLFEGADAARAMVGSHNLTAGGLEVNYESGVEFEFSFPADHELWKREFEPAWTGLQPAVHPNTAPLDQQLLKKLIDAEIVIDERFVRQKSRNAKGVGEMGECEEGSGRDWGMRGE